MPYKKPTPKRFVFDFPASPSRDIPTHVESFVSQKHDLLFFMSRKHVPYFSNNGLVYTARC